MPSCIFVPVRILDKKIETENIANGVQKFPSAVRFFFLFRKICAILKTTFYLEWGIRMSERKEVYVLGHRNPDTDSICSAIAYADVKNKENDGNHYVAARAGQISSETSYVLQRFGMRQPTYVNNIGTRVRDMEIRKIPGINEGISMKKAWSMMAEMNAVTLPIVDANNVLDGIITINDIATSYMENQDSTMIAKAKTPYCNILETLEAKMLVGDPDAVFEHGNVVIAVANPDVMENYIEKDDMVITGNRYESQLSAIESGAGCILVCLGAEVSRSIQKLARDNNCAVLTTPLDTYTVAHRISQCMPVKAFMRTKDLVTFTPSDYTDAIKDTMQNTRIRDFPVIDKNGKYVGMISRRNLLGIRKRSVILVDHNERSQAVENIENAEILEIIDHHRIGSLETMAPVYFRNEPVGCTATIIYSIYKEKGFEIPPQIAGLLCSAILSDTLMFRSPTCTLLDRAAAEALSAIAGIDCQSFGIEMFTAGSNLKDKTPEEIFYQDYKKFEFGDVTFGVGQINSMSGSELDELERRLRPYLEKSCREHGLSMMFFMLTNIIEESTRLMCYGESADMLVEDAFGRAPKAGAIWLKGVVSRKKQLIPAFIDAISKEAGGGV